MLVKPSEGEACNKFKLIFLKYRITTKNNWNKHFWFKLLRCQRSWSAVEVEQIMWRPFCVFQRICKCIFYSCEAVASAATAEIAASAVRAATTATAITLVTTAETTMTRSSNSDVNTMKRRIWRKSSCTNWVKNYGSEVMKNNKADLIHLNV